jgi:CheY-like chemotaxis protein
MPRKRSILVIDDEPRVGDALDVILRDNGYRVVVSQSGLDALNKARKESFDLAITDVGLPDISGLDVLRHLRKRNRAVLVIVITANPTPAIIDEASREGAVCVLRKPFLPSDVLDAINTALSKR